MGCAASKSSTASVVDPKSAISNGAPRTTGKKSTDHSTTSHVDDPTSSAPVDVAPPPPPSSSMQPVQLPASARSLEMLCGTSISLHWLYRALSDALAPEVASEPQWIAERVNNSDGDDRKSEVLRVSFNWDNEKFPSTVIMKLPIVPRQESDLYRVGAKNENGEIIVDREVSQMHRREGLAFEWLAKQKSALIPRIYCIRRATDDEIAVIVMEDLHGRGLIVDSLAGLSLAQIKVVLKAIAAVHAASLKRDDWHLSVADLPRSYYEGIASKYPNIRDYLTKYGFDAGQLTAIESYFTIDYLQTTISECHTQMSMPVALIHGDLSSSNLIFDHNDHDKLVAVIDWQCAHPGCIMEDVAKLIACNVSSELRHDQLNRFFEYYHYNLLRFYANNSGQVCPITMEQIKKAYQRQLPVAMCSYLLSLLSINPMQISNDEQAILLQRARALVNDVLAAPALPTTADELTTTNGDGKKRSSDDRKLSTNAAAGGERKMSIAVGGGERKLSIGGD